MGKNNKNKPGSKRRENKCVVTFNEDERQDYLTGFHKRKVERRKKAVDEIKKKIKEEQKRMREERHKEYVKMLRERTEALEEAGELDHLITSTAETVQYDHPNHTVTVTTVSDLDLSGAGWLGRPANQEAGERDDGGEEEREKETERDSEKPPCTLPKKSGDPILSQKLSSLTSSLHSRTQSKGKGKGRGRGRGEREGGDQNKKGVQRGRGGRTSKSQRRKRTGRARQHCA
ncbi:nucleolar protein 12 [Acipenser ruthenus]|uniref:nucleolar protein 12 n=1 Tax=Acipenser ruthenus TaxID=7906 RepID=UPI0027404C64|nr:nucleolar protein 12 [Acipenser ruthenus]